MEIIVLSNDNTVHLIYKIILLTIKPDRRMKIAKRLIQICKDFTLNTSVHGFVYIGRGHKIKFWTIVFILMLALCTWQCLKNLFWYLSYKVQVSITMSAAESYIEFPAITFGTMYLLKRSQLSLVPTFLLAPLLAVNKNRIDNLMKEVLNQHDLR